MKPTDEETLYAIIRHVRPLYRHLLRSVEHRLEGTGITVLMRAVMECLADTGLQTVPQIARTLMVERQVVQRVVDQLRTEGLVERQENPAHRRSWLIGLTPSGGETFTGIRQREQEATAQIAAGFKEGELEDCLDVLSRLTAAWGAVAEERRGS